VSFEIRLDDQIGLILHQQAAADLVEGQETTLSKSTYDDVSPDNPTVG